MIEENRKRQKTGGRQKGSLNKSKLVRLRDKFEQKGFDFVDQVMQTLEQASTPDIKLDALVKLAPYFMQRLRQEEERPDAEQTISIEDELDYMPTAQLLELVKT